MTRRLALPLLATAAISALGLGLGAVIAAPVSYKLPDETAAFKPGPNLEVVQNNCTGCHSADHIAIQPRGPKYKADFWKAEVTKMIKVYGAPINEADVPRIVEYLAATY
jgi:mono/diheme cytochrome c family protein